MNEFPFRSIYMVDPCALLLADGRVGKVKKIGVYLKKPQIRC